MVAFMNFEFTCSEILQIEQNGNIQTMQDWDC